MILLFDMDNVVTDLNGHIRTKVSERFPDYTILPPEQHVHFEPPENYPGLGAEVRKLYHEEGFFLEMSAIPGAIEGLLLLLGLGHDVRLCTSQVTMSEYCLLEKHLWLQREAPELIRRLIITKDKTYVRGDLLVDDKPVVTGALTPVWRQVLYDQPHNQNVIGPRMSWDKIDRFIEFVETFDT